MPTKERLRILAERQGRLAAPASPVALVDLDEAARLLSMSRRWLQQQIAAGRLRPIRFGPRATRVRMSELEQLVADAEARRG